MDVSCTGRFHIFRKQRSWRYVINYLVKNAEIPHNVSVVICTDFSKGFDRVNHTIAVEKLLFLGARPSIIPWICDFLTNRTNCVRYQGVLSSWQPMRAGVPQGTRLGPLIFFLALIDDALRDQRVKRWKYVDDMSIADNYKLPGHTSSDLLDSLTILLKVGALTIMSNWILRNVPFYKFHFLKLPCPTQTSYFVAKNSI